MADVMHRGIGSLGPQPVDDRLVAVRPAVVADQQRRHLQFGALGRRSTSGRPAAAAVSSSVLRALDQFDGIGRLPAVIGAQQRDRQRPGVQQRSCRHVPLLVDDGDRRVEAACRCRRLRPAGRARGAGAPDGRAASSRSSSSAESGRALGLVGHRRVDELAQDRRDAARGRCRAAGSARARRRSGSGRCRTAATPLAAYAIRQPQAKTSEAGVASPVSSCSGVIQPGRADDHAGLGHRERVHGGRDAEVDDLRAATRCTSRSPASGRGGRRPRRGSRPATRASPAASATCASGPSGPVRSTSWSSGSPSTNSVAIQGASASVSKSTSRAVNALRHPETRLHLAPEAGPERRVARQAPGVPA